jgi:endonuclease G
MNGYDPNFLGVPLPLPVFLPDRTADVLRSPNLVDGLLADYPNYAVVTDKRRRSPVFAVLHIDQQLHKSTPRSDNWKIDTRVGAENQLDNAYYADNPWDRGHMARRDSAAWGPTQREAQKASDETFYYTNATLQHENVNQDEWLALEEWVLDLDLTKNGRLTVFAGPIYGDFVRTIRPAGRPQADVPSAFFKVVCFVNKATDALDVRAFIVLQDEASLRDKQGRKAFNFQNYQVTIREIEQQTGLDFPDEVYERNPLFFHPNEAAARRLNIPSFPERIDVNGPADLVGANTRRVAVADDDIEVYLAAAMVRPKGGGTAGEWVSILNLEPVPVDLKGWRLVDKRGQAKVLGGVLQPGESKVFKGSAGLAPVQLPDTGGLLTLLHKDGRRVDRVDYTAQDVKKASANGRNLPVNFATYRQV